GGFYPIDHGGGGAGKIHGVDHFWRTFGVGDDLGARIGVAQLGNIFGGEGFVHFTGAGPGDDLFMGLLGGVLRQILIGDHHHRVALDAVDDVEGVGRGAAHIGDRFYGGGGVHIGDDRHAGIAGAHGHDVFGGDAFG